MSNQYVFLLLIGFGVLYSVRGSDVRELKCQVCTRVIEEMQKNISKVDVKKTITVGGFRLDDEGNYSEKIVPLWKSEIYLTELMDDICLKMEDYVRATYKKDGKHTVISLLSDDGGMNPIMSEVDVVQDTELNKSLKFHCEDIVDEHSDTFLEEFKEYDENLIARICGEAAQLCDYEVTERPVDEL